MKKILMGTSAVALSSMAASSASAAEWDLDWGGYFEAFVGLASVDSAAGTDFDGVDVRQDAEIQFTPSITLDNGLKFGVDVQLEANAGVGNGGTPDVIDESFAWVKGSFGQVLIGSENSAGYKMSYGAPDVTALGVNSGSISAYLPIGSNFFRTPGRSSFVEVDGNNDSQRLTYFTPRFSGFQFGVSYARDGVQDGSAQVNIDAGGTLHDIFDVGANYVNTLGGVDVAIAGRYGTGTFEGTSATAGVAPDPGLVFRPNRGDFATGTAVGGQIQVRDPDAGTLGVAASNPDDPETYAFGINLGFQGFSVGGSYASEDGGNAANDGDFFDIGISYGTGPWAGSLTYAHSDLDAVGEMDQYIAGVTYKLGPGVKAGLTAAYIDIDESRAAQGADEAFIIETGFALSF